MVILILCAGLILFNATAAAQQFGRFFTTPKDRKHLQELRQSGNSGIEQIKLEDLEITEESPELIEEIPVNAITLKGIVYRNSKRTAWINDSNTYEGDPAISYLKVDEKKINSKSVEISLPKGEAPVTLKPGQSYDPQAKRITDVSTGGRTEIKTGLTPGE